MKRAGESQLQRIIRKTGRKPIQCKCKLCQQQCHTPCLATPQDILKLIKAGSAFAATIDFEEVFRTKGENKKALREIKELLAETEAEMKK